MQTVDARALLPAPLLHVLIRSLACQFIVDHAVIAPGVAGGNTSSVHSQSRLLSIDPSVSARPQHGRSPLASPEPNSPRIHPCLCLAGMYMGRGILSCLNEPGYTVRVNLESNPIPVCMHPAPGFVSGTGNRWQSTLGSDAIQQWLCSRCASQYTDRLMIIS
jgi:hypothetical protein